MERGYTLYFIAGFLTSACIALKCKQIGPCTCEYNDGDSQQVVTLEALAETKYYFSSEFKHNDSSYEVLYQPCKHLAFGVPTQCVDQFVCENKHGMQLGGQYPEMSFSGDDQLIFTYHKSQSQPSAVRTTRVTLLCDEVFDPVFHCSSVDIKKIGKTEHYDFHCEIRSDQCCPQTVKKSISPGSVLIILFVVGILLYLIIGLMYNRCSRGATGVEVLPNYEFWVDFPALIKDGCIFFGTTICCCCRSNSESTGYDNI